MRVFRLFSAKSLVTTPRPGACCRRYLSKNATVNLLTSTDQQLLPVHTLSGRPAVGATRGGFVERTGLCVRTQTSGPTPAISGAWRKHHPLDGRACPKLGDEKPRRRDSAQEHCLRIDSVGAPRSTTGRIHDRQTPPALLAHLDRD